MAPRPPRARQMLAEAPAAPQHGRGRSGPGGAGQREGWHRGVQQGMPVVRGMAGAARPCPPRPPRCERPPPPGDAGERRSQPQGLRGINKHVKEHRTGAEGEHSSLRGSPGSSPPSPVQRDPVVYPGRARARPRSETSPRTPGCAGEREGRVCGRQPHSSIGPTRAGWRGRSGHGGRCPCLATRDLWTRCRPPRAHSLPALLHRELRNPAR